MEGQRAVAERWGLGLGRGRGKGGSDSACHCHWHRRRPGKLSSLSLTLHPSRALLGLGTQNFYRKEKPLLFPTAHSCYLQANHPFTDTFAPLHRVRLIWHCQLFCCRASSPLFQQGSIFGLPRRRAPSSTSSEFCLRGESPLNFAREIQERASSTHCLSLTTKHKSGFRSLETVAAPWLSYLIIHHPSATIFTCRLGRYFFPQVNAVFVIGLV